jgi:glycosyltransferase involved in cell wall biosynthesis
VNNVKIIHIIDNLRRGGAETLLLDVVRNLKDYNHHIITLTDHNGFNIDELAGMKIHSLGFRSMLSYPVIIVRLRNLLRQLKPTLIHAHLPFASFLARVCRPAGVPLFISVHNNYSDSLKAVSRKMFFLEKSLHSAREELIFVSGAIKEDYERIIGIKSRSHVLYNFIADKYFQATAQPNKKKAQPVPLRLVSVGSFKYQKNFDTLLKAFALLDPAAFTLDIYGNGPERDTLEGLMSSYGLNQVRLMGVVPNIEQVLPCYDAFILASRYEGFGLAPLEAAALQMPLLLSDIQVFKEVTRGHALFFNPGDPADIASSIRMVSKNYGDACANAAKLQVFVQEHYSLGEYLKRLENIYHTSANSAMQEQRRLKL